MTNYTPSEMATLRRAAAQWKGTALSESIGARLRLAFKQFVVARDRAGRVAGFAREGFLLTPKGCGLYFWHERPEFEKALNWREEGYPY